MRRLRNSALLAALSVAAVVLVWLPTRDSGSMRLPATHQTPAPAHQEPAAGGSAWERARDGTDDTIGRTTLEQALFTGFTLVDLETNEPIAHMRIKHTDPLGAIQYLDSDSAGRCEVIGDLAAGAHRIQPWVGWPPERAGADWDTVSIELLESTRGCVPVSIRCGPLFAMHVLWPHGTVDPSTAEFFATIITGKCRNEASVGRFCAALRHVGETPWVRFAPSAWSLQTEPVTLGLLAADGHLAGHAEVVRNHGQTPTAIEIEIHATATARIQFLPPPPRVMPGSDITFRRLDGESNSPSFTADTVIRAIETGDVVARWLVPGPYEIAIPYWQFQPIERNVLLEAGANRVTFHVELLPTSTDQELRASCLLPSHSHPEWPQVDLRPIDGRQYEPLPGAWTASIIEEREAVFRWRVVPNGTYRLTVCDLDGLPWLATPVMVTVPGAFPELSCPNVAPNVVTLEPIDATSSSPISEWFYRYYWDRESSYWDGSVEHGSLAARWWSDVPMTWTISADGYRTAHGVTQSTESGGNSVVRVPMLKTGWAAMIRVESDTGAPMSGAVVSVTGDGDPGVTGADGLFWLELDERPATIRVELEGYSVDPDGYLDAETGGFLDPELGEELTVIMRRKRY